MINYITKAGDDIDGILWAQLKRTDDDIEREFWRLNPDAALKLTTNGNFPQGVGLVLPDLSNSAELLKVVSPWD